MQLFVELSDVAAGSTDFHAHQLVGDARLRVAKTLTTTHVLEMTKRATLLVSKLGKMREFSQFPNALTFFHCFTNRYIKLMF